MKRIDAGRVPLPRPWISDEGDLAVDLTSSETHVKFDLEPLFAFLRDEHPVIWHPPCDTQSNGSWVVSRHADAIAVCRDADTFSSSQGNVIDTLLYGGDPAGSQMLAVSDGQRHEDIRRLLWQSLTPEGLTSLADRVRHNARAAIAEVAASGECDFARDIAARLPLMAICDLLGIPARDRAFILDRTSSALSSDDPATSVRARSVAKGELLVYFEKLVRPRRNQPTADATSLLVNGIINGRKLSVDEIVLNCYSLILGGDETTRLAMIGGMIALVDDPDQWAGLKAGTVAPKTAADEIVRWTTPAMHVGRTAMRDVRMHNKLIKAGDVVVAWLASANFDPREFQDPLRLDLSRRPNRQLSFAYGDHFCLGAHLARLEICALLECLRDLVQEVELIGAPHRVYSNFLSGYSALPVRMRLEEPAPPGPSAR